MSALRTTPGKWRALKGARNYGIHSNDGTRLATVFASGDQPTTRNLADALAMAAAPELLAALLELVALEADGKQCAECAIESWERARAAIAKSEGSKA